MDCKSILVICSGRSEAQLLIYDLYKYGMISASLYHDYKAAISDVLFDYYAFFIGYNSYGMFSIISVRIYSKSDFLSCYHGEYTTSYRDFNIVYNYYNCKNSYSFLCFHLLHKHLLYKLLKC